MRKDQDKKEKKRARPVKKIELTKTAPLRVHSRHLAKVSLRGKNFRKNILNNITLEGGELLDIELINAKQIDLTIRAKAISKFSKGKISLKDPSSETPLEQEIIMIPDPITGVSVIPAGEFIFGDNRKSNGSAVTLPEFGCALFEITNRDYMYFLNFIAEHGDHSFCHPDEPADKSHIPDFFHDANRHHPGKPVSGIDWFDAYAYTNWLGYRLPTTQELEKAVRGTGGWQYPWGDEPKRKMANTSDAGTGTVYVSLNGQGVSQYGIYNGVGNVWEWTASEGNRQHCAIIKGGSFKTPLTQARTFSENSVDKLTRREDIGFRFVVDLHPDILKTLEEKWAEEEKEKIEKEKAVAEKKEAAAKPEPVKKETEETKTEGKTKESAKATPSKVESKKEARKKARQEKRAKKKKTDGGEQKKEKKK